MFDLFNGLRRSGLSPDEFSLSSLVKGCGVLEQNEVAHGVCLKMGLLNGFVVSGLLDGYAKLGDVDSAEKCFKEFYIADSVVWTAMVCGFVWNGEFEKGREVFVEMRGLGLGLELNEFSLTSVLGALSDVREGEQVFGLSVKMGLLCGCSIHLNNALMNMYSRCGSKSDAIKMFDEMTEPDVVSWTERIGAAYDAIEAFELFRLVLSGNMEVNEYMLINVLSAMREPKLLKSGRQIQGLCQKAGYLLVASVNNALIFMYGKCGEMVAARHIFDEMLCGDSVSWNSLIAGYAENGLMKQALKVFSQMRDYLLQPNKYTLASILEVAANSNFPEQAMQIHSYIVKLGFIVDDSMLSCLITAYGKCNMICESKRVYSDISQINVLHLNAMAATLVHAGCHADALKLFQTGWRLHQEVDCITLSIVLKACGALTDLEYGRNIHSMALKSGMSQDNFVESAVIDVYCKCGTVDEAAKTFMNVSKNNLVAWNAMVMGYAQHGCYHEVFELFNKMLELGIEPDEITYLGVLNSCCHAGLVNEAHTYLSSMLELHGVVPCLEHYACMIDLFGRVGLLEDAKRTIDQMPIMPDAQIWQILLSGCNIHGNVDLGEVAAKKLIELQPENDSAYVLLSNLYASAGRWNAVGKLRRVMKKKIICKEPGSSWIQVRGSVHYFFASDTSHPESKEIYMKLQRLYEEMFASPYLEQDRPVNYDPIQF